MSNDYKSLSGSKHRRVDCERKRIVDNFQESVRDVRIYIPRFPCRLLPSSLECQGGTWPWPCCAPGFWHICMLLIDRCWKCLPVPNAIQICSLGKSSSRGLDLARSDNNHVSIDCADHPCLGATFNSVLSMDKETCVRLLLVTKRHSLMWLADIDSFI